jgi:mannose-6-phosphate isomerase-like protein (cupin superfamily)
MTIQHKDNLTGVVTPHGEVIYELFGRNSGHVGHSLAQITLPPGGASLFHYHPIAEESYYILRGRAKVRLGDEETIISAGHSVLIKPPTPHQISNAGDTELEFLAVCVPAWEISNTVVIE